MNVGKGACLAWMCAVIGPVFLQSSGCDKDPADGDDDDAADEAWFEPDPDGRTTDGDILGSAPEMVIITSEELAEAWAPYAEFRNLSGLKTDVVTVADILAAVEGDDDAEAVRNYLAAAHEQGLRFALMGGDADHVPFRRTMDTIQLIDGQYTTNGPTQLYYADLDTDWGDDGDIALEDMRDTEIAVGRVPAGTPDEVGRFVAKARRYETEPDGRETYPLLMSDIASSVPILGDIDGAEGVEASFQEFFPPTFQANALKLYATEAAAENYGGEVITSAKVKDAFDEGYLLAYHNGHGNHNNLTDYLNSIWVQTLSNELPPVFMSCSCLTGNFADVTSGASHTDWSVQGPDDDSAGELFITEEGGVVSYVGNVGLGLGPIGGSQFLHAMFEGIFEEGTETIGEAFNHGRARMRDIELVILGFPMAVNDDTERWTQLIVILLGDPALRIWRDEAIEIGADVPQSYGPGYQELAVTVTADGDTAAGDPVAGATVVLSKPEDFLLRQETGADGTASFGFIPHGPETMTLAVTGPSLLPVFEEIEPE